MASESYHYIERPASQPGAPLFFVFHGTGGDENQFFGFASGALPKAHVISPRGDVSEGGALRFFRRTGEGVYDMEDLSRRTAQMASFVESFKTADSGPVIGLGYSNGANILASVMFEHSGLFDAAALLHPLIPFTPAEADLSGTNVLVTAGRNDPICPAPLTEDLLGHLEARGAGVTAHWHPGGHQIAQSEVSEIESFLAPYR